MALALRSLIARLLPYATGTAPYLTLAFIFGVGTRFCTYRKPLGFLLNREALLSSTSPVCIWFERA